MNSWDETMSDDHSGKLFKITRRSLFLGGLAFFVCPPTFADSSKSKFEYIPSKIGIDYRKLAPSPLAEILSHGEGEWIENALTDYGSDTKGAWKEEMAPEIASGAISIFTIEEMKWYTPNMLIKFAVGLNPTDPKYGVLWSVGNAYVAGQLADKS